MEIKGKVIWVGDVKTGVSKTGREWSKMDFTLEYTKGEKKNHIYLFTFSTDIINSLAVGQEINATFEIDAREYNGRWYNDFRVWKVETLGQAKPAEETAEEPTEASKEEKKDKGDNLPF